MRDIDDSRDLGKVGLGWSGLRLDFDREFYYNR